MSHSFRLPSLRSAMLPSLGTLLIAVQLQGANVSLQNATASFSQPSGWGVGGAIDGVVDAGVGWAIFNFTLDKTSAETAVFESVNNVGYAGGSLLTFKLSQVNHNPNSTIGRFRLSVTTDGRDAFADGLSSGGDVTANWSVLTPATAAATGDAILTIQGDGSILASGTNPISTVYTVTAKTSLENITGFRLEVMEDPSLPHNGPGRYPGNGNFVLTEFEVQIEATAPSPDCAEPPSGLVAWWPFNGNGNDAVAMHNAVLSGSPQFAAGRVDRALRFDGLNDSGLVSAAPGLHVGAGPGLTVEGWIKPADLSQLRPIVEWNDGNGTIGPHFWVSVDTQNAGDGIGSLFANLVDMSGNSHQVRTPQGLLSTGVWQHVALSYDKASGQAVIYHNGVAKGQANLGSFTPRTSLPLYFGLRASGAFSGIRWAGDQDEITLFGRALSSADIQAIYGAGAFGKCKPTTPPTPTPCAPVPSGIVGWWPLEGDANDVVANQDGVLIGFPSFTSGKVRSALQFDGVNDLVRIPATPALNVGAGPGLTIEGWINPSDLSHLRPIAEWNSGNGSIGTLFWAGVQVVRPGDGDRNLLANLMDSSGGTHIIHTPAGLVRTGVWQHVALTYEKASGRAAIYYNGSLITQSNLGTFTLLTTGDLYFGNRPSGAFSGIYWSGGMDEMTVYSHAILAGDIASIHAAGAAGKCSTLPPPPPPPPTNCVPPSTSLVGWWPLEGNGNDVVGRHDGELAGNPVFGNGEVGRAMRFDGSNDRVRVPASAALNVGTGDGFTIEGWINPADLSQLRPLVEWNGGQIGVHFWTGVDSAIAGDGVRSLFANLVDVSGNSHQLRTPKNLINTGTWQHVALTYNKASGEAAIYYNGDVAATSHLGTFTPSTSGALNFGNRPAGPFSGIFWQGGMDEMSLYRQALTATDVRSLYAVGALGKCAPPQPPATNCPVALGLVGWWPFEGNAEDLTGNHDGQLSGSPVFTSGKVKQGLQFDGLNDLVRVPASPTLNVGTGAGLTVEGWINPADLSHLRPIAEWNGNNGVSGIGALFWTGVQAVNPGDGDRNLTANLIDTAGTAHTLHTDPGLVRTGVWQHVALTYDKASGRAVIYYNGAAAAEANLGSFTPRTTGDLYFGNRPAGPFSGIYWSGGMDEMSLYDRALTAANIATVHAAGAAGKCSPTNTPAPAGNHAPVAKALIAPIFHLWPHATNFLVISGDGEGAEVIFDGSMSFDADGDALQYFWMEAGEAIPFAAGVISTNRFDLGDHTVRLGVADRSAMDQDLVSFEVITLSEAVDELTLFMIGNGLPSRERRPLMGMLRSAGRSFERGHLKPGIQQLNAFQQKVRTFLLRSNPNIGRTLINAASDIIDAATLELEREGDHRGHGGHGRGHGGGQMDELGGN